MTRAHYDHYDNELSGGYILKSMNLFSKEHCRWCVCYCKGFKINMWGYERVCLSLKTFKKSHYQYQYKCQYWNILKYAATEVLEMWTSIKNQTWCLGFCCTAIDHIEVQDCASFPEISVGNSALFHRSRTDWSRPCRASERCELRGYRALRLYAAAPLPPCGVSIAHSCSIPLIHPS